MLEQDDWEAANDIMSQTIPKLENQLGVYIYIYTIYDHVVNCGSWLTGAAGIRTDRLQDKGADKACDSQMEVGMMKVGTRNMGACNSQCMMQTFSLAILVED